MPRIIRDNMRAVLFLTEYARANSGDNDGDGSELVIPESFAETTDEALAALHEQALAAFNAVYGNGEGPYSPEDVESLSSLAEGLEAINTELAARQTAADERAAAAGELASRVLPADAEAEAAAEDGAESTDETNEETTEATAEGEASAGGSVAEDATEDSPAAVAASAGQRRGERRISLPALRSRQARTPRPAGEAASMTDVVFAAADNGVYSNGEGIDWDGVGRGIDRRLMGFPKNQYQSAARAGRHLRQQFSVAMIRRPFTDDLMVTSDDPGHVDTVLHRAMDETRLPQGSLVASGGWCAPSETIYDLCSLESTDGMLSLPEIGISRGGIRFTQGPDFSDFYNNTGFCYTEEEDEAGDYDGDGGGSKPCFKVDCPDFDEARLNVCGTCISAGLLQARGYPEMIARTTQGAMVAHAHRVNANVISSLVAGSDAVVIPGPQAGATAPLLTSIELQVEAVKYAHRMARNASLEGVFPYWVRGVIRADLARRLGVDLIDVPDTRIDAWFRERGINPQYVYDWQDLNTEAPSGTAYPESVDFLLYPAGTWVKGTSDVISLDTVYDSTMLGTNDYTALFFEEGWLTAKLCHDSRVVTVPLCGDGSTHAGVDIACDGTEGS